jgi:hypothetical protein
MASWTFTCIQSNRSLTCAVLYTERLESFYPCSSPAWTKWCTQSTLTPSSMILTAFCHRHNLRDRLSLRLCLWFCCGSFLNTKTQRPVNIMYVSKLELSIIASEESTLQDGNGSHHSQRKWHMNRSSLAFFVSSKAPDAIFSLQEFEKRKSGNMKMISWRLLPLKLTTTTLASSLKREWETGNQSFQSTRHLWFSLFEI